MIEAQLMVAAADLANRAEGWVDFSGVPVGARIGGSGLAAEELAPALHVSPMTAFVQVERALTCCLPLTLAALAEGDLDIGRALAIYDAAPAQRGPRGSGGAESAVEGGGPDRG